MKEREKWMDLCEQVSKVQDPEEFMRLILEVDRLLAEKQRQVERPPETPNPKAQD